MRTHTPPEAVHGLALQPAMHHSLEDLRLRALDGDRRALDQLCARLSERLFPLALRMLGDVRDAEDATQDALVKVVTHLAQFEGLSRLSTWAHAIAARHIASMSASRAEQRALQASEFASLLEQGLAFGATAPPTSPEDHAFLDEVRLTCTQGMLFLLDRDERLAIVLVELLAFDASEAAVVCGVSHEALRQRLSRARARLGAFLQSQCGQSNPEAACSCERQLPAKLAVAGRKRRLSVLSEGDVPAREEHVALAAAELRHVQSIASAFRAKGAFGITPALRERIESMLPRLMGGA